MKPFRQDNIQYIATGHDFITLRKRVKSKTELNNKRDENF